MALEPFTSTVQSLTTMKNFAELGGFLNKQVGTSWLLESLELVSYL